ncbi:MAG: carbohydrate ABC transporter permease [Oscillospiraceae bacterium]|nr:carbohydrate ABC transporter permease [Oscillospiraceae bacterium]
MSYKLLTNLVRLIVYIIMIFIALLCIVPIYILFINATRSTPQINSGISFLPSTFLAFNWGVLGSSGSVNLFRSFGNSAIIAFSNTIITVYFAVLTAYAIEVYNFKLKKVVYSLVMLLVMIPGQVAVIGFYMQMSAFGWLNTFYPLIIPAIAVPTSVFFAKQYLESCLVKELIHAGRIDGCSELGIMHKIMMPIAIPGMFTMAIFAFVGSWNNFFTPFLIITDQKKATLPMAVQIIVNGNTYNREIGAFYLGLAISIVPVVVVYICLSKFIVGGMAMGAVKE